MPTTIRLCCELYRAGANVCRKEIAVHNLIQSEVPVPKILYAEPDPVDDIPSFAILEFVDGLTFQQLKRTGDVEAIKQASSSVANTRGTWPLSFS